MTTPDETPAFDASVAHPARRYNYWLGGKDNFTADRASGDRIATVYPQVVADAQANRAWMHRVVRALAVEQGVRQFLDVGVALPVTPNVHEIAQQIDPASRVLYLDNDPLVMVHARALLTGTPEGVTGYAEIDMHDTNAVIAEAKAVLDFSAPIAVLYGAVLHFVLDDQHAYDLVASTVDWLPAGSYVAISNFTLDGLDAPTTEKITAFIRERPQDGHIRPRTRDEFTRLFNGLDLLEPGVQLVSEWRPDLAGNDGPGYAASSANAYAAMGRKAR